MTPTDDGWKTVREKPDRIKEVNKEIQALGVKVGVITSVLAKAVEKGKSTPAKILALSEMPGSRSCRILGSRWSRCR